MFCDGHPYDRYLNHFILALSFFRAHSSFWWNIVQLNRAQSSIQKFVRTVITLRKYIHNYISTYFLYCHCFTSEIFAFKRRYNWTNKCPIICGLCSLKHHTMIYVRELFNIIHSILEGIWQCKILFSYYTIQKKTQSIKIIILFGISSTREYFNLRIQ